MGLFLRFNKHAKNIQKITRFNIYKYCKNRESVVVGDEFCIIFTKEKEGRNRKG